MTKLKDLANAHPVWFTLFIIITWFLVAVIGAGVFTLVSRSSFYDYGHQSFGSLVATLYILFIAWQFGWLRASGIANLGRWEAWLSALVLFVYLFIVYSYSFFGEVSFEINNLFSIETSRSIIWRQLVVGVVEEVLFRGVILYALVRVWGGTWRGLSGAVLLSAFLFGILHLLQVFAGLSFNLALVAALESTISGIWWGAFVLLAGTIWPILAIHAGSNMLVQIQALSYS